MVAKNKPLRAALASVKFPAVVAFGNPLLDIIVHLDNDEILNKFNLKVDGQQEVSQEKIQEILAEISPKLRQITSAGGCAENTVQVLQWLCFGPTGPSVSIYCGGLGQDARGKTVEGLLSKSGVTARYAVHPTLPSGICVSLVYGTLRTLLANLGAAETYSLDNLNSAEIPWDTVKLIYIEGFFVTHSLDVVRKIMQTAQEKNIFIVFNLSGVYIFEEHHAAICELVGMSKIIFGNANEMAALAKTLNISYEDVTCIPFLLNKLKKVGIDVSNADNKDWLKNDDIFVMTQGGSAPAIMVWGQGQSCEVPPVKPEDPVIDTTGAGDSLVGGFLAGVLAGWEPKKCLELGCSVAALTVTRPGICLPESVPSNLIE